MVDEWSERELSRSAPMKRGDRSLRGPRPSPLLPRMRVLLLLVVAALGLTLAANAPIEVAIEAHPTLARSLVSATQRDTNTAILMPLLFRPVAAYNATSLFHTRGAPTYMHFLPASGGGSDGAQPLGLSLQQANPLWARWRFARFSNHSLTLTNQPLVFRRPPYLLTWPCDRASTAAVLCDTGAHRVHLVTTFKALDLGEHVVLLDPSVPRGRLPSSLYRALAAVPRSHGACLEFAPEGARLCAAHLSYFDMHVNVSVRFGAAYLAMNTSLLELDGIAGHVAAYHLGDTATTSQASLRVASAVVGMLVLLLCWVFWAQQPDVIDFKRFVEQARAQKPWPMEAGSMWLSAVLILGATLCLLLAWLGIMAESTAVAPMTPLGPDVWLICIGGTVYVAIQLVLHIVLVTWFDVHVHVHGTGGWADPHAVSHETAWARHLLHVTLVMGASNLALLPMCINQGLIEGSDFVLLALIAPQSVLIVFHTYYAVGALALAWVLRAARLRFKIFAVGQVLLLLALVVSNVVFLAAPLLSTMSTFYSQELNFVSAMGLELLAMLMGLVLLLVGYAQTLHTD